MSKNQVAAAQGGEYSYHGAAAKKIFGEDVGILDCGDFPGVVRASRSYEPGMGVIAIRSALGTVDRSAAQLVRARPSALPTITGRTDLEVSLVLSAATPLGIEDLSRTHRIYCHGQQEAWEQCEPAIRQQIARPKFQSDGESTRAIKNIVALSQPNHLAIGPAHAVEPLGAFQVGSDQLNPPNSITRFYALQRDPRLNLFEDDPGKTSRRSVVSLAHPENYREMDKVIDIFHRIGIVASDFILFRIGDFTKHRDDQRRAGGIFEVETDRYSAELLEFCARVDTLQGHDGADGPFSAKILGDFAWYPEEPMDLDQFAEIYDSEPSVTRSASLLA